MSDDVVIFSLERKQTGLMGILRLFEKVVVCDIFSFSANSENNKFRRQGDEVGCNICMIHVQDG